jgi:NADH dehydrogenase FAD-containing subunit
MRRKRVVLAGAGHAHLPILRRAQEFASRDIELLLISPDGFWYSGLATGVLGGRHGKGDNYLDPETLLPPGQYIRDQVTGLDVAQRRIHLQSGDDISYDALSFDLGSVNPVLAGDNDGLIAVKPIANLTKLRSMVEDRGRRGVNFDAGTGGVAIVGSGVTAFEVAANLCALATRLGDRIAISIHGRAPLPGLPTGARDFLLQHLAAHGVSFHLGADVVSADARCLHMTDGTKKCYAMAINATGLVPPPMLAALGLPLAENGALLTDGNLQCDDGIFAGGDCIAFRGHPLAPVGVHAVRQAPILLHNLLAALDGTPLRPFRPRRRHCSIINLGDGTGLAMWGGFWLQGRIALVVKDFVDYRFIDR